MGSLTLLASYYVWPVGRPGGDLRKEELGYLFTQLPPCHLLLAESLGLRSLCLLCCAVLSRSVVSNFLWPPKDCPWGSSVHGDTPGKNTGMGCHALLQGIFPTKGLNPGLLHCRQILYHLSHQGSPKILEWVAYPFSRGTSWPRKWTGVSSIAGGFFAS